MASLRCCHFDSLSCGMRSATSPAPVFIERLAIGGNIGRWEISFDLDVTIPLLLQCLHAFHSQMHIDTPVKGVEDEENEWKNHPAVFINGTWRQASDALLHRLSSRETKKSGCCTQVTIALDTVVHQSSDQRGLSSWSSVAGHQNLLNTTSRTSDHLNNRSCWASALRLGRLAFQVCRGAGRGYRAPVDWQGSVAAIVDNRWKSWTLALRSCCYSAPVALCAAVAFYSGRPPRRIRAERQTP